MHEIVDATRVALKLLDYKFKYEFKKHFCFYLKNSSFYLYDYFVIVRHNRIIVRISKNDELLFTNLFKDVTVKIDSHSEFSTVTYSGSPEQIAKMIIEFDDMIEMLNRSLRGDNIAR